MTKNEWQRMRIFLAKMPKAPKDARWTRMRVIPHAPTSERFIAAGRRAMAMARAKRFSGEDLEPYYAKARLMRKIAWDNLKSDGLVPFNLEPRNVEISGDFLHYAKGKGSDYKMIYFADIKKVILEWTDYEGNTHRF